MIVHVETRRGPTVLRRPPVVFASGNSSDFVIVEVQFKLAAVRLAELENKDCSVADTDSVLPANGCACYVPSDCESAVLLLSASPAVEVAAHGCSKTVITVTVDADDMRVAPPTGNQVRNTAWYVHRPRGQADGLFARLL